MNRTEGASTLLPKGKVGSTVYSAPSTLLAEVLKALTMQAAAYRRPTLTMRELIERLA
jgi:hypothetical protein